MEIDVNGDPGDKMASETTINRPLWLMVIGYIAIVLGGLALLGYTVAAPICYWADRRDRSRTSINAPATPSTAGPATPERTSSPAAVSEQSPRTPQPFIDYVRRTIDETPYYRREPRRRVNPQNTF